MRKNIIAIVAVVILAVWGFYDYYAKAVNRGTNNQEQTTADIKVGINKGNKAPEFELLTLDGKKVKLSDFASKKIILNFWATWCPPCRAEMPHMEKFYKDYEKKDVVVLAVNLTQTEKKRSDVTAFVQDFGLTFPIVMDEDGNVMNKYQIVAYPTSYIMDSKGIIKEKFQGAINYEVMEKAISKIK